MGHVTILTDDFQKFERNIPFKNMGINDRKEEEDAHNQVVNGKSKTIFESKR